MKMKYKGVNEMNIEKYIEALNNLLGVDCIYYQGDKDVEAIIEIILTARDLAKENELLKAQVSELSSVNEVAEEIQQNPEVESTVKGSDLDQDDLPADDVVVENIVDDDLPEGDLPEEDLPESDHPNDVPQEDTDESESGTDAENADVESTTADEVTSEGESEPQVSAHENVEQTSQEADGTLEFKFE